MSKKFNFDISCFKDEFQKFIFQNLNIQNYYEFINIYNNQFSINIECHSCGENTNPLNNIPPLNVLSVDEDCSFNDIKPDDDKAPENKIEETSENSIDSQQNLHLSPDNTDDDTSDNESDNEELTEQDLTYTIDNSNIILKYNKKFMNKKLVKKLKKNGGKWMKKTNQWILPISKKSLLDNIIIKKNDNHIQEIKQEDNRVVIIPTQNHPKYGTSIIYDKSNNIGIWDSNLKGWVFDKKI